MPKRTTNTTNMPDPIAEFEQGDLRATADVVSEQLKTSVAEMVAGDLMNFFASGEFGRAVGRNMAESLLAIREIQQAKIRDRGLVGGVGQFRGLGSGNMIEAETFDMD